MSKDRSLDNKDLDADPFTQFERWYQEYLKTAPPEPSAMALATASKDGTPSIRFVLLKSHDTGSFVFFTNYESEKAKNLAENPRASLAFYWNVHNRQVRVTGSVERVSAAESDAYFASRPFESQLSAWASKQSSKIESREWLEMRMSELQAKYPKGKVPRPPHWGGFRVTPERIEFWQGRVSRLHDRLVYVRDGKSWRIDRLSP
ncbi:MAG: pyridoxamine 5'-phosphate oxidase [Bdellovibrionia bacterium]